MDVLHRPWLPRLALSAALLCSSIAHAQAIIKCRIDGRLVYQSTPCALEPPAAMASPLPVAASASAGHGAPKKKTLADMLRERDGDVHARTEVRELQGDGANILRSRMGAR